MRELATAAAHTAARSCRVFPASADQVGAARQFLAACLNGDPHTGDAVPCVSEIVSNAVQHSLSARPGGHFTVRVSYLPGRLRAAARAGRPIVLTLAELRAEPPRLSGEVLFVCENPSIVAAAANALGPGCPPLLCTSGWPNTAVAAILDAAEAAGMGVLVHADGDEAGAAIAARVLRRTRARPWRSVDPSAGIHEEALLDDLLDDLGSGWVGQRRLVA